MCKAIATAESESVRKTGKLFPALFGTIHEEVIIVADDLCTGAKLIISASGFLAHKGIDLVFGGHTPKLGRR